MVDLCLIKLKPRVRLIVLSWKTICILAVVALSLQIINIGLSWWIQVMTYRKSVEGNALVSSSSYSLSKKISSTLSDILNFISQSSVLDSSGEYRFAVGVLRGKTNKISRDLLSEKKTPKENSVTLVTQCSLSRVHLLPELSIKWKGPVSVSVFLLPEELESGIELLQSLQRCFPEIEANTTFSVVYPVSSTNYPLTVSKSIKVPCNQVFSSSYHKPNYELDGISYPNNLLRNVAQLGANTNFVMVLDVDMLPSHELLPKFMSYIKDHYLSKNFGKYSTREEDKTAWIVPAYEIEADMPVPKNKLELLEMKKDGKARPFYQELCWKCQKYTGYEAWEKQPDEVVGKEYSELNVLHEVLWKDPWEPFYIARANIPLYDERFRQYGFNRISQVCELHVAGYRFVVLNSAFVVHKGLKKAGQMHVGKDKELEKNRILFRQFKEELKQKYPESSRRKVASKCSDKSIEVTLSQLELG